MRVRALAALARAVAVAAAPAQAQDGKKVLKIGWAQEPQTLSPFIDQDEEDFRVWAINYDLLVNFSPEDLGPVPGIAESWDVSRRQEDRSPSSCSRAHKWSDGQPITSKDVKYSLEMFGANGLLFTELRRERHLDRDAGRPDGVVKTKKPDARIVGGLFVYILPEHIWGKQSVKKLTATYRPTPPIVGSGPYIVTEFDSQPASSG